MDPTLTDPFAPGGQAPLSEPPQGGTALGADMSNRSKPVPLRLGNRKAINPLNLPRHTPVDISKPCPHDAEPDADGYYHCIRLAKTPMQLAQWNLYTQARATHGQRQGSARGKRASRGASLAGGTGYTSITKTPTSGADEAFGICEASSAETGGKSVPEAHSAVPRNLRTEHSLRPLDTPQRYSCEGSNPSHYGPLERSLRQQNQTPGPKNPNNVMQTPAAQTGARFSYIPSRSPEYLQKLPKSTTKVEANRYNHRHPWTTPGPETPKGNPSAMSRSSNVDKDRPQSAGPFHGRVTRASPHGQDLLDGMPGYGQSSKRAPAQRNHLTNSGELRSPSNEAVVLPYNWNTMSAPQKMTSGDRDNMPAPGHPLEFPGQEVRKYSPFATAVYAPPRGQSPSLSRAENTKVANRYVPSGGGTPGLAKAPNDDGSTDKHLPRQSFPPEMRGQISLGQLEAPTATQDGWLLDPDLGGGQATRGCSITPGQFTTPLTHKQVGAKPPDPVAPWSAGVLNLPVGPGASVRSLQEADAHTESLEVVVDGNSPTPIMNSTKRGGRHQPSQKRVQNRPKAIFHKLFSGTLGSTKQPSTVLTGAGYAPPRLLGIPVSSGTDAEDKINTTVASAPVIGTTPTSIMGQPPTRTLGGPPITSTLVGPSAAPGKHTPPAIQVEEPQEHSPGDRISRFMESPKCPREPEPIPIPIHKDPAQGVKCNPVQHSRSALYRASSPEQMGFGNAVGNLSAHRRGILLRPRSELQEPEVSKTTAPDQLPSIEVGRRSGPATSLTHSGRSTRLPGAGTLHSYPASAVKDAVAASTLMEPYPEPSSLDLATNMASPAEVDNIVSGLTTLVGAQTAIRAIALATAALASLSHDPEVQGASTTSTPILGPLPHIETSATSFEDRIAKGLSLSHQHDISKHQGIEPRSPDMISGTRMIDKEQPLPQKQPTFNTIESTLGGTSGQGPTRDEPSRVLKATMEGIVGSELPGSRDDGAVADSYPGQLAPKTCPNKVGGMVTMGLVPETDQARTNSEDGGVKTSLAVPTEWVGEGSAGKYIKSPDGKWVMIPKQE